MSWIKAWEECEGPRTLKEKFLLFSKGFAMGTADVIPGVSGGTIAYITGIYDQILAAIAKIEKRTILHLLQFKWKKLLGDLPLKFLLILLLGIGLAILSTARLMHFLITDHPTLTWSFFFGLIGASIWVVWRGVGDKYRWTSLTALGGGFVFAFALVGVIPVKTPDAAWFIFCSGAIAISAMMLPGISGSFVLLMLGKYATITGALKSPFEGAHLQMILTFMAGQLLGVLSFSRVLNYFFTHFRCLTMAAMTGLMAGSLRKIWPWKITEESILIRGKEYILQESNRLPHGPQDMIPQALGLMLLGAALVVLLDACSQKNSESAGRALKK